jgi:hypothetical protein
MLINRPSLQLESSRYHHHCQNSPLWTIALLRRFCQICQLLGFGPSDFHLFVFRKNIFFTEQGSQPCFQHPTWRSMLLNLCPPVTACLSYTLKHRVTFSSPSAIRRARWMYSNPPPYGENLHIMRNIWKCVVFVSWSPCASLSFQSFLTRTKFSFIYIYFSCDAPFRRDCSLLYVFTYFRDGKMLIFLLRGTIFLQE